MKKKILVVDDEPDHCALVQRILEKAGYEVDVAYDGRECLQKVSADPPDAHRPRCGHAGNRTATPSARP
jgi:two-component system, OmpR family, alkaline phosphatase synthesis response regulator PhoP